MVLFRVSLFGMFCFGSLLLAQKTAFDALPDSCVAIGRCDIGSLMAVQILNLKDTAAPKDENDIFEDLGKAGLDLKTDVEDIYFGLAEGDNAFVAVLGLNRPVDLHQVAKQLAKERPEEQMNPWQEAGFDGYILGSELESRMVVTMLSGNWWLMGTEGLVRQAIEVQKGKHASITSKQELMRLARAGGSSHLAWVAAREMELEEQEQLDEVFLYFDYLDGVEIGGSVTTRSQAARTKIQNLTVTATMLLSMLSGGQLTADAISVTGEGETLNLQVRISEAVLEAMKNNAPAMEGLFQSEQPQ
jgi:hypothetical protein